MTTTFWRAVGGRKVFSGYIATVLLTAMAIPLGASFVEYSGAILLALGITAGTVAAEDAARHRRSAT